MSLVTALCLLLLSAKAFCVQLTEVQARELTRASVIKLLGGVDRFLDITRDSALEHLLGSCLADPSVSAPYIFRVATEGEEKIDANTVIAHISTQDSTGILVAVSSAGHVFLIRGAIDAKQQFNNLASELGVELSNNEDVRRYLDFYLRVDPENRLYLTPDPANQILLKVHSADDLRDAARRRFLSNSDEPQASHDFGEWWRKHSQQASKFDFDAHAVRVGQRYKINFYVLSDIDRKRPGPGPRLFQASIQMSSKGDIGSLKLRRLRGW